MRYLLIALLATGCGTWCEPNWYPLATDADGTPLLYGFDPNLVTESGIQIDTDISVDLEAVDAQVARIESCVRVLIDSGYRPDPGAQCIDSHMRRRQDPGLCKCLGIKLIRPVLSLCTKWHLLPDTAPPSYCDAKGLVRDPYCPCRWRWWVQRDYELVTTIGHLGRPYLYDVTRIMTGCNAPWNDPELRRCYELGG